MLQLLEDITAQIEEVLDDINTQKQEIDSQAFASDSLATLLQNKPSQEEYDVMKSIEELLNDRQLLMEDLFDKEREILDQKSLLEEEIHLLREELKAASEDYNELTEKIPPVQRAINQVYAQVYTTETVTHIVEQKNPWIEAADDMISFFSEQVQLPADSLTDHYHARNEVERWVPGFFFTSDMEELQSIVDTVLYFVDIFDQLSQLQCSYLEPSDLKNDCNLKVYWIGQIQTPFVQSLTVIVEEEVPVFSPQHLQKLDSLRNVLNGYRLQMNQLADGIEHNSQLLETAMKNFVQTMTQLENDKTSLENSLDDVRKNLDSQQQELADIQKQRDDYFDENKNLWRAQKFTADSLVSAMGISLSDMYDHLGILRIDSTGYQQKTETWEDQMDEKEQLIADTEKIIENLEKVIALNIDDLLSEKRDNKQQLQDRLKDQEEVLKQLLEDMDKLLEDVTLTASGAMVYYIPPPLEKIMKDTLRFEELKTEIVNAKAQYEAAVAFKASLQGRYTRLLENLSRDLQKAKMAQQQLDELQENAENLSGSFEQMHEQKKQDYEDQKQALQSDLNQLKQQLEDAENTFSDLQNERDALKLQVDEKQTTLNQKKIDLLEETQKLSKISRELDSLNRESSRLTLTLRELDNESRAMANEIESAKDRREQAHDRLSIAVMNDDQQEENTINNLLASLNSTLNDLQTRYDDISAQRGRDEKKYSQLAPLLESQRAKHADQLTVVAEKLNDVNLAEQKLRNVSREYMGKGQSLLELQRNQKRMENRLIILQHNLDHFPSLGAIISEDSELQDAHSAMVVAQQDLLKMQDLKKRSILQMESITEERDSLEKAAREKLEKAIAERDKAKEDLREFLLEEFEEVEFADTLRITAKDDVIDGWRSSDDKVEKEVIIRYNATRIPELLADRDIAVPPVSSVSGAGSCEVDLDSLPLSSVVPQASQVLGPEPRTIALVYENGKPLWPEWPVLPNTSELLAGSVLQVKAGGYDRDLIIHLCHDSSEDCDDPIPPRYVFEDVLDFNWQGNGSFFNQQAFSDHVLWIPEDVDVPDCDELQDIQTFYVANTVVPDPQEQTLSRLQIQPGVMIEVTDSLMGYPDHSREVVARIVKGDYTGLPGEDVKFTVELVQGQSEGWGFGEDSMEVVVATDQEGYARADFQFGDGFAAFNFTVNWIRQEDEPECQSAEFLAEAPVYLEMHYLGYSVESEIRQAAKDIWEGSDIESVISEMDDLKTQSENGARYLLAVAGLLDHNRDFVNARTENPDAEDVDPGTIIYEVEKSDPDLNLEMEPQKALTEIFGIADSYVHPDPGEGILLNVSAQVEEVFEPLGKPPKDQKEFDTKTIREFRIGKENDLFVVRMDEDFSPYEPVYGTGTLFSMAAPGQLVIQALGDLSLDASGVILEEMDDYWVAIDGRVGWKADAKLSVDTWGFTFLLDSLAIYPVKGAEIGGKVNHQQLSYPVGFSAALFTNGDFYGQVYELPEIEVGDLKLHRGAHVVIDWSKEKSPGDLDNDFRGIVIRSATLDFPPVFRSSDSKEPASLQVSDFAIGTSGLQGSLSIYNTPVQLEYAGFEFSCDSIAVRLEDSEIKDFAVKGSFTFPEPVNGSVTATVSIVGDSGWAVELETGQALRIPRFNTSIALNSGTSVTWDSQEETGTATLNATISSDYFSEIDIKGLEFNNKGVFKAEAIEVNRGIEIGGSFSFHMHTIAFSLGEDDDHLLLDGELGLSMIASAQLGGELILRSGPAVEFRFKEARLEYERDPFRFAGELSYTGSEFLGAFEVDIKNLFQIQGVLIFGTMPLNESEVYDYWYVELASKTAIPLGQVAVITQLGGGVGYNYQPPVGARDGVPDFNESLSFKAIVGMGNTGVPPGKIVNSRMEMVFIPGVFTLYGKVWALQRENAIFGEGTLNLRWEPETKVDGKVRTYIGLADAEGKIFRFNGEVAYDFHSQGYLVKSQDISGHLFEKVRGEMALEINDQFIDVNGRIFYEAEGEVDIAVALIRGYAKIDAQAEFSYVHAQNRLRAQTQLEALGSVDLINRRWNFHANIIRGKMLLDCSIDASPQRVRFDANAHVEYNVWFVSGTREMSFGFEV